MITAYLISRGTTTKFNILEAMDKPPVQPQYKPVFKRDARGRFVSSRASVIEKNPLVFFDYPVSTMAGYVRNRAVRVISSNCQYLTGLELLPGTDKWQFKKFCQSKITGMRLSSFNPESMS
jgi:hypothetical protein